MRAREREREREREKRETDSSSAAMQEEVIATGDLTLSADTGRSLCVTSVPAWEDGTDCR